MRPIAPHTIVVLAAATGCTLAALSPWIQAGAEPVQAANVVVEPVAGEDGVIETTLEEAFEEPDRLLGHKLRFTFQLENRPETWNPYLTRFGRTVYGALSVWGDEKRLWVPEDYEDVTGLVFARKESRTWQKLAEIDPYARVEAEGVVRQVSVGRPWIELTYARVLPRAFSEGALIHASRGVALMRSGQFPFAANEFERARATELPLHVDTALAALEETCRNLSPPR